jgi:hypothetical protein
MNEQFTPGKWSFAHRKTADGMFSTEVFCEAGKTVATLAWYPKPTVNGVTGTYREGNARLIAAAPEMLDALRRAVLALAFAAESSKAMQDDYEAVSLAIAKATGAV